MVTTQPIVLARGRESNVTKQEILFPIKGTSSTSTASTSIGIREDFLIGDVAVACSLCSSLRAQGCAQTTLPSQSCVGAPRVRSVNCQSGFLKYNYELRTDATPRIRCKRRR